MVDIEQVRDLITDIVSYYLTIELSSEPWEIPILDSNGNCYGMRHVGNRITAQLRFGKDGEVISQSTIEVKS